MSVSISLELSRAVGLEHHEHVRQRMRHRIFRALGPPGAADDIVDFRDLSQDVLHAVIQAIDFLQGGLGRQDGLQKECAFVELRHEVAADARAERQTPEPARSSVAIATTSQGGAGTRRAPARTTRFTARRSATSSSALRARRPAADLPPRSARA